MKGMVPIIIIFVLLFGIGGLVYLYAKHLGKGDVRAAFDNPPDRKKIIIVGVAITGFFLVVIGALFIAGVF